MNTAGETGLVLDLSFFFLIHGPLCFHLINLLNKASRFRIVCIDKPMSRVSNTCCVDDHFSASVVV